ncbi:MAG: class I SAM-dependent methyltransferase [Thermoclostridium sp.]|nr:class I SAM-dependent methyltransferase [Thermoclostridium sp.]
MGIDYEKISKSYDSVRYANQSTISIFVQSLPITKATKVLDFGCGTGNYADTFQKATHAQVFGVEPSDGMREKAAAKNSSVVFAKGNHEHIPFEDSFFDFVYMTDVIHHIPDLGVMFREIFRVLKKEGHLCIVTESHEQIDRRFYVKYFPTTAIADKHRYPDIPVIISYAVKAGFSHIRTDTKEGGVTKVQSDFVDLVRAKGYSMFHLIPEEEYQKGLIVLEKDVMTDTLFVPGSGETLVWLGK